MINKKPPTIKDIARELKVSPSTVSRALNGYGGISQETIDVVKEVAKAMDYQPNVIARSLRSRTSNFLGIVIPDIGSHFFESNLSGIQNIAYSEGYNVVICHTNESCEQEKKKIQTLISKRVSGLLICLSRETTSDFSHLEHLNKMGIPVTFFDRVWDSESSAKVIVDDEEGAYKAVKHLIEIGCKRIAHLSGPENLSTSVNRKKGYMRALRDSGFSDAESLVFHTDLTRKHVSSVTNALLNLQNYPDAIFAINDRVAFDVMSVIKEKGLNMPEDIALVGFDNNPVTELVNPSLTSVHQPAYDLGVASARLLIEQIKNPEKEFNKTIVLQSELIIRNSSKRY